jgi:hypothetical protein
MFGNEDHNENDNLPKKFKPLALQEFLSEYQPLSVDLSGTRMALAEFAGVAQVTFTLLVPERSTESG